MKDSDRKLIAALLKLAGESFSNHGCNDLNLDEIGLSETERVDLDRRYHDWNGDPQEHDPERAKGKYRHDSALMDFMAHVVL